MKPSEFDFYGQQIPEQYCGMLERYIDHHILPGSFLEAVLSNDLKEACSRADSTNIRLLPVYVAYLWNYAPARCWGSPEKVEEWLSRKEETDA
ncbi:hypothetical protein UFOVP276_218 [uncultured Caudovirales phage]|uniref:Uncharacterized protein n=1 Tax=uncultured Caudovirales phage TaxID=2100421 RepID=A0A6J5LNL6_9CAUD|nr:hypothetical protein UFOVP127_112 [uncultured Caudovirales phage]CAB4135262.1 hypothetical protein UFOVP276_218 [uncultured Caudovirales phage]